MKKKERKRNEEFKRKQFDRIFGLVKLLFNKLMELLDNDIERKNSWERFRETVKPYEVKEPINLGKPIKWPKDIEEEK